MPAFYLQFQMKAVYGYSLKVSYPKFNVMPEMKLEELERITPILHLIRVKMNETTCSLHAKLGLLL
jgi:hypothetical protein